MPRERTLLTAEPVTPEALMEAVRTVEPEVSGAMLGEEALQLRDAAGELLITAVRTRQVVAGEAARLLGTEGAAWWTDVVVPEALPWARASGILDAIGARLGGVVR